MNNDDLPPLTSLDELWPLKDLAEKLGVKPDYLNRMRWGDPPLPYLRFAQHIFYFEPQVVQFLNEWQKQPDPYYIDRMRRLRAGIPVGRGRMPHKPSRRQLPRD